jgi:hypothetical protein
MSAYNRGELSLEAYLVRILAALCRQNGGELRIKGELVDAINEPTTLLKDWDSKTQELVLRTHMGSFGEVFRVVPEKQPTKEVIAADPIKKSEDLPLFTQKGSTLDDEKLKKLETDLTRRRVAAMITEDLKRRRGQPEA